MSEPRRPPTQTQQEQTRPSPPKDEAHSEDASAAAAATALRAQVESLRQESEAVVELLRQAQTEEQINELVSRHTTHSQGTQRLGTDVSLTAIRVCCVSVPSAFECGTLGCVVQLRVASSGPSLRLASIVAGRAGASAAHTCAGGRTSHGGRKLHDQTPHARGRTEARSHARTGAEAESADGARTTSAARAGTRRGDSVANPRAAGF